MPPLPPPDSPEAARRAALRNLVGFALLFLLLLAAALALFFREENRRVSPSSPVPDAPASPDAPSAPAPLPNPASTTNPATESNALPDRMADALAAIREARDAIESSKPQLAAKRLRDAIAIFPNLAEAHRLLGIALLQTGDIPTAVHALETSLSIEPLNPEALSNLSFAYLQLRNTPMAVELIETCRRLHPDFLPALLQEGLIFLSSDPQRSVDAYLLLLQQAPDNNTARDNLAVAYSHLGDFEAARNQLSIVLSKNPADLPALFNMAAIAAKVDRDPEATVQWLQRALPLAPIASFQQYLNDPDLDPVRSTPPFQAFLSSLNPALPPPSASLPP